MKKFLSLLTVFVLAFTLAVPVGATSSVEMKYDGVSLTNIETVWDDKVSFPYPFIVPEKPYRLYLISRLPEVDGHSIRSTGITNYEMWDYNNGVWEFSDSGTVSEGQIIYNAMIKQVVWTGFNMVRTDGSIYKNATEPVENVCDGSSCPATDANIDGSCDDCGMTLMSLSRSPVAPDVTGSNKNYVMFYSGNVYKYTVYTSDESYTIRGEEYGARYRTYTDPSVTVQRYESYDGINWEQTYTGKTANDYPGEIGYELISSTFDWYTEAGDRFFPVPLWEEVQTVTQGEMGILTSETAGTMRTLVVCGVGLMACLMALSLFGKRWLLFLR